MKGEQEKIHCGSILGKINVVLGVLHIIYFSISYHHPLEYLLDKVQFVLWLQISLSHHGLAVMAPGLNPRLECAPIAV